ncbi:hypothetical protein IFU23_05630 [Pantoea agglomerans]|uniref:Uncharacterized protein n=1 Tax=Enterobacter agglomerans TaxID=549 RepID=A0ACC5PVH9_ENTAG|nr:hypothetical protein [Pantoea agglomerans]MBD8128939.1 hypothetical protein [Pantoea agglomerans]MBD8152229.1 hypothetical protein [Pantoea agglomerans]MBD8157586.1 hypothetical protein [Pantoea agglomerans]MBD8231407.1 hypothetical protein [Pantoea agglomerans]MBD8241882.1 hypothetical protein [Pantoea agglomerans]
MRYYELDITDSQGKPIADASGNALGPLVSTDSPAGALNIIFDIYITSPDVVTGGTMLAIYGLPMAALSQSVNLFGANVTLYGGFSGGLPLERPEQQGILLQGNVFNPYANWQGVNQSLNLIVNPGLLTDKNGKTLNILVDGRKGEKLDDVVRRALNGAYPDTQLDIRISDKLVLPEDWKGVYNRPSQLATAIKSASLGLMNEASYTGVSLIMQKGVIRLFDNLIASGARGIEADEFIGQPTWIGINRVSFKTPLRGDLMVGDEISLPDSLVNGTSSLLSVNAPEAYGVQRGKLNFSGNFFITSMRHVGEFRNASGEAWVTIFEAVETLATSGGNAS